MMQHAKGARKRRVLPDLRKKGSHYVTSPLCAFLLSASTRGAAAAATSRRHRQQAAIVTHAPTTASVTAASATAAFLHPSPLQWQQQQQQQQTHRARKGAGALRRDAGGEVPRPLPQGSETSMYPAHAIRGTVGAEPTSTAAGVQRSNWQDPVVGDSSLSATLSDNLGGTGGVDAAQNLPRVIPAGLVGGPTAVVPALGRPNGRRAALNKLGISSVRRSGALATGIETRTRARSRAADGAMHAAAATAPPALAVPQENSLGGCSMSSSSGSSGSSRSRNNNLSLPRHLEKLVQSGNWSRAIAVFEDARRAEARLLSQGLSVPERARLTRGAYNQTLLAYAKGRKGQEALALLREMRASGAGAGGRLAPGRVSYNACLQVGRRDRVVSPEVAHGFDWVFPGFG